MKICHIDTETTGVDAKLNGIIQVAGIMEIDTKQVGEFDIKVQPHPDDVIEDRALEVNKVTREQLALYPAPATSKRLFEQSLAQHVSKFNKTDKFWFVGYNASFDWNFMQEFYRKAGDKYFGSWFHSPFIDTAVLAAIMLMDKRNTMTNFKQSTAAAALGIKFDEAELHDALADVRISKAIFDMFMQRVGVPLSDLHKVCTVQDCMMRTR